MAMPVLLRSLIYLFHSQLPSVQRRSLLKIFLRQICQADSQAGAEGRCFLELTGLFIHAWLKNVNFSMCYRLLYYQGYYYLLASAYRMIKQSILVLEEEKLGSPDSIFMDLNNKCRGPLLSLQDVCGNYHFSLFLSSPSRRHHLDGGESLLLAVWSFMHGVYSTYWLAHRASSLSCWLNLNRFFLVSCFDIKSCV